MGVDKVMSEAGMQAFALIGGYSGQGCGRTHTRPLRCGGLKVLLGVGAKGKGTDWDGLPMFSPWCKSCTSSDF